MCGLVGAAGKIFQKEENAFKFLLQLDVLRGPHSTGIAGVSESGGYKIIKKVGTPWDLFYTKECVNLFNHSNIVLIGHNRYATKGAINDENAHPFDIGNVIGAHNGTIYNQHILEDHECFAVDSENILHSFNKVGVESTVSKINGAFAITWYDKRAHTINFCRNSKRPLYYCYASDNKTLFWASEDWMLDIALSRAGVDHNGIVEVEEKNLYSMVLPNEKPYRINELKALMMSKLEYFVPPPAPPAKNYNYNYNKPHQNNDSVSYLDQKNKSVMEKLKRFLNKTVTFVVTGLVEDQHGNFIRAYLEDIGADVVEVRLFLNEKDENYSALLKENLYWTGEVKKITTREPYGNYLVLNNRTVKASGYIEEGENCDPFESDVVKVCGKVVGIQEWYNKTSVGCDNCCEVPIMADCDDLEWYTEDNFFCKKCFATQEVQNFLSICQQEMFV